MADFAIPERPRKGSRPVTTRAQRGMFNIGLLLFGALPLWIATEWLQALVWPPLGSSPRGWGTPGDAAQIFIVQYLAMALPLLPGALVHQWILAGIPRRWPRWAERLAMFMTAPVVAVVLIAITGRPDLLGTSRVLLPTVLALAVYVGAGRSLRAAAVND